MAGKVKTAFVCGECGYESPKWVGKCPRCGNWNTMNEEIIKEEPAKRAAFTGNAVQRAAKAETITNIDTESEFRYKTGIGELDLVLGGGIVKGSVILLSGDPGIGKSTLLMQLCGALGETARVLYVSGEESARQLKLRADRLSVSSDNITVLPETDIETVTSYISDKKPDLVMVDSIQTMNYSELSSSSGSVAQVRECANLLLRVAKAYDIPTIIVGHVNKDGNIAGPKVMEHIVDTVLYFEGERNYSYRILRAVKNRFGSTNEIGVFEMFDTGLKEVENPSSSLLSGRTPNVSGSCIACVLEGSRPILAEVQALVTTTGFGYPKRMSTAFDANRLNLILAVLEKRMGYYYSNLDVYLNIVGGIRIDEPATDLSVVMSLVSGLKDKPLPEDLAAFGEIGLAGEVRSVPRAAARLKEISKMGFTKCLVPKGCAKQLKDYSTGEMQIIGVKNIWEAVNAVF